MAASRYYERNIKTLQALTKAGANSAKVHTIEHHIYCQSIADVELVTQRGSNLGYEVMHSYARDRNGKRFWSFDLVKKSTPTIENIEVQSFELLQIIDGIDAQYDGWGTEVEK